MTKSYAFTPEDDPNGVTAMFDPYSAWSLRYALDFDLTRMEDIEDPDDFRYMFTVETFQAGRIEDLPEPFKADGAASVVALTTASAPDGPDGLVQAAVQSIAPFDPADNSFSALAPSAEEATSAAAEEAPPRSAAEDETEASREEAEDSAALSLRDALHYRAPLRKSSLPERAAQQVGYIAQSLSESTAVIVGIVDDGINPLHEAFQDSAKNTRLDFAWVQDAAAPAGTTTVPFGRELTKPEIDATLASGPAPEHEKLTALGLADFRRMGVHTVAQRLSHGTHVCSLAAGDGPDDLRLLTVQLPATVTLNTSGAYVSPFVMAGVAHILQRAFLMSQVEGFPIPVVINFSYALSGGPHNGLHFLERAIDTLVQAHLDRLAEQFPTKPTRAVVEVVLPSGNRVLARGHAEIAGPASGRGNKTALTLPWRVQPGDESPNFLEIWMPRDASGLELWITPPGGSAIRVQGLGPSQALVMHPAGDPASVIGRISLDRQRGNPASDGIVRKKRVLIALTPSCMPAASEQEPAPSGLWQVELKARVSEGEKIEAWIQRDDAPLGYHRQGRQSYFDDPLYERWDASGDINHEDSGPSVVRRSGTLNGIATGRASTVIGPSMTRNPKESLKYAPVGGHGERASAAYGAASSPTMRQPDASAEADRSKVAAGVIAAGAASGSRVAMNGSSVAAPQFARHLAEELMGSGPPNPEVWPVAGVASQGARLGTRALPPQVLVIAEQR